MEYAILTDEITKAWAGMTTKGYKNLKGLKKENFLTGQAEATTTEISKKKETKTFSESKKIANQGGTIAGNAKKEIEEKTGESVVSPKNAKALGKRGETKQIRE